jgi:hypothetical protein
LQVFGQAGAGKSKTVQLMNHMHYYLRPPKELQSTGQTQWPIIAAVAASSSMPVVFEEVKKREMAKTTHDMLLSIFRSNYNANTISRGGLSRDTAAKTVVVNEYANRSPLVFCGEALEDQTAIIERCVIVEMAKKDREGRRNFFEYCLRNQIKLGSLGKALATSALHINYMEFKYQFETIMDMVRDSVNNQVEGRDRPEFNVAVVISGLQFLKGTLHNVFGDRFDEKIDQLSESMMTNIEEIIPKVISEAAKVLDVMAQMSKMHESEFKMQGNTHYTYSFDDGYVDIKLKPAYSQYVRYCRSLGQAPLYDTVTAFVAGMSKYSGCIDKKCQDNRVLYTGPFEYLFRFSVAEMEKEEVEAFRPTS